MKIFSISPSRFFVTAVATILVIFITKPGRTQDTGSDSSKKESTIHLKIVKDDDGKTTTIDTTITYNSPLDREEIRELVHKLKGDMKAMKMNMKKEGYNIDLELENLENLDSLENDMDNIIVLKNKGKGGNVRIHRFPQGFNYDYDFECPELPELPEWESPEGFRFDCPVPCPDHRILNFSRGERGSLNELLGDIPMDRVKSYSIKDRKNGKRIVIDLEDGPFPVVRDRMVIVREKPQQMKQRNRGGEKNVRVIVRPQQGAEEYEMQQQKKSQATPESSKGEERPETKTSTEKPKI
ncbi:MAG TPA: hypothetical protein PKN44_04320 [Bacteroidales bacterium]|nr:hypothetical protein [Bacteroidales bacterium]HPS50026.1 hypothetical protein [Bacteroidales bacterium]